MRELRELIMGKVIEYEESNNIDKRDALLECIAEIDAHIEKVDLIELENRYNHFWNYNEEN